MKIILIIVVCLCSCYSTPVVTDTTKKLGDEPTRIPATHITHFEYNGHEYIKFRDLSVNDASGYVHNPDCKCYKKLNKIPE